MKRNRWAWIGVALAVAALVLALAGPAWAEGELTLSLNKNVGSKIGNQAQGRFTLSVRGPQDITSVTYEIDGAPMATVTQAPFGLTFDTGQYPLGTHRLQATAQTAGGARLTSAAMTVEFVSSANVARTMAPILAGLLVLAVLLTVGPQLIGGRGKRHYEPGKQDYGLAGGTICPRCRRPFAYSLLGANLLVGKLQRCPYCGKWAILRRASPQELAAAEAAAAADARPSAGPAPLSEEEKLRRQIDDSRYQG